MENLAAESVLHFSGVPARQYSKALLFLFPWPYLTVLQASGEQVPARGKWLVVSGMWPPMPGEASAGVAWPGRVLACSPQQQQAVPSARRVSSSFSACCSHPVALSSDQSWPQPRCSDTMGAAVGSPWAQLRFLLPSPLACPPSSLAIPNPASAGCPARAIGCQGCSDLAPPVKVLSFS